MQVEFGLQRDREASPAPVMTTILRWQRNVETSSTTRAGEISLSCQEAEHRG